MTQTISLAQGNGGEENAQLISKIFYKHFRNEILEKSEDAAIIDGGRLAFTTDSFTVSPIFFDGGDIGKLSICGTCNDLAMMGAKPTYMTCAVIVEEGFSVADLETIVASMKKELDINGAQIVCGDTKVVPRGSVDKIFIRPPAQESGAAARSSSPVTRHPSPPCRHGRPGPRARRGPDVTPGVRAASGGPFDRRAAVRHAGRSAPAVGRRSRGPHVESSIAPAVPVVPRRGACGRRHRRRRLRVDHDRADRPVRDPPGRRGVARRDGDGPRPRRRSTASCRSTSGGPAAARRYRSTGPPSTPISTRPRGALALQLLVPALLNLRLDLVVVDGQAYLKAPILTGDSWVRQALDGGADADPGATLEGVADLLADPSLEPESLPDVRCAGTDCYSVRFTVPAEQVQAALGALGGAIPGLSAEAVGDVVVTAGIRKDDQRLATLALDIPAGGVQPLSIALEVSKVNEPVTIEAPPPDEVTDAPGGILGG